MVDMDSDSLRTFQLESANDGFRSRAFCEDGGSTVDCGWSFEVILGL